MLAFACICLYLLVFVCICLHLLVFACIAVVTAMFTLSSYSQLNFAFPSTYLLQRSSRRIKRQQWQVCIGPKPPKEGHHVEADSYVHNMFSASTPFANKTTTNTSIVFKYLPSRLNNNFRYSPQSSYRSSRRIKRQQWQVCIGSKSWKLRPPKKHPAFPFKVTLS